MVWGTHWPRFLAFGPLGSTLQAWIVFCCADPWIVSISKNWIVGSSYPLACRVKGGGRSETKSYSGQTIRLCRIYISTIFIFQSLLVCSVCLGCLRRSPILVTVIDSVRIFLSLSLYVRSCIWLKLSYSYRRCLIVLQPSTHSAQCHLDCIQCTALSLHFGVGETSAKEDHS